MIRGRIIVFLWLGGWLYPGGNASEAVYGPGKILMQEFYPGGQLRYEGYTLEGLETGYWRFYYSNGKLRKHGEYLYGLREHWWEEYYDNGKLKMEGAYREGRKVHYWTYYTPEGILSEQVFFVNGKRGANREKEIMSVDRVCNDC